MATGQRKALRSCLGYVAAAAATFKERVSALVFGSSHQELSGAATGRRKVLKASLGFVVAPLAAYYPTDSEAFLGFIFRFLARGAIRREAGKTLGYALSTGARAAASRVGVMTVVNTATGVVFATVAAKQVSEWLPEGAFSRLGDLKAVTRFFGGDDGPKVEVEVEVALDASAPASVVGRLEVLLFPQAALHDSNAPPTKRLVVGQVELQPGQAIVLREALPVHDLHVGTWVAIPGMVSLSTGLPLQALTFTPEALAFDRA